MMFLPIVHGHVVEICPVEKEIGVEPPLRAGVGKIERLLRVHGKENLHQGKQAGKHTLGGVLFNLMTGLADGNAALFQLNVNQRHPVD